MTAQYGRVCSVEVGNLHRPPGQFNEEYHPGQYCPGLYYPGQYRTGVYRLGE